MARVWIEAGCIQCGWCQNLEPRVFIITETGCEIIGECRIDALTDDNRPHRSALREGILDAAALEYLPFVAGGCPVQVIQLSDIESIEDPLQARAAG
jgi:hypothetical protein